MTVRCPWCMGPHRLAECSSVAVLPTLQAFGTVEHMTERSTADDAFDALQLRCHQLRATVRGLLAEMRAAGIAPSPETLSLSPDSFDP